MKRMLLVVGLVVGCGGDNSSSPAPKPIPPPSDSSLTYVNDVFPLVQRSCLPCHGGDTPQNGTGFDTKERMTRNAGKAQKKINAGAMPPAKSGKPKISQKELRIIVAWYNGGAN